jgi:hypothetical protein
VTSWSDTPKTAAGIPGSRYDTQPRKRGATIACQVGRHSLCAGHGTDLQSGVAVRCYCICHERDEHDEREPQHVHVDETLHGLGEIDGGGA